MQTRCERCVSSPYCALGLAQRCMDGVFGPTPITRPPTHVLQVGTRRTTLDNLDRPFSASILQLNTVDNDLNVSSGMVHDSHTPFLLPPAHVSSRLYIALCLTGFVCATAAVVSAASDSNFPSVERPQSSARSEFPVVSPCAVDLALLAL